ncbi:hypothetical protein SERLA73DRAFT_112356 [Serpula lacrymans var. lacrymans S7.3]|uniref:Metallo-beta-lactamase domain-containing protein n=2 Tax=Serpula lacrymans var. lacrymans TaxID=341189 RepID=F8Q6F1_SERL3|nr:uncharacterized protein SERLADRAFT_474539 [Serpula lacrymans var. lacrymans S7.9]EGN96189.1 hypothetical protein SERLA73DRAFT_112356 [Serpula lacrymans var. lacrymans S7.3]EGO21731.1 hypothetical protein SERLADRAFT_474539 [Serpula lacrymans var. lacrymans S7.9]
MSFDYEDELLVCVTCGTQFDVTAGLKSCHICDDPRQYVPPTGQSFTRLSDARRSQKHKNEITQPYIDEPRIWTINTVSKLGIGQRAFLIKTQHGNVLWDDVAYIDHETVEKINELGGIDAIVISHPHFYTTHLTWSRAFNDAPVYLASDDEEWLARSDTRCVRRFVDTPVKEVLPGVTAIKVGGHFPGSMVLHWENRLFVADSIQVAPSALYDVDRQEGTVSFGFLWSYPNMIPLSPAAISHIVKAIQPFSFDIAHGMIPGAEVKRNAKAKVIESARTIISAMGYRWEEYV